jgi:hypothetical protein
MPKKVIDYNKAIIYTISNGYYIYVGSTTQFTKRKNHHKTCCNNPKYKDYGGRGISVCDRWLKSFTNFYNDMGKRPSSRYSLDRINNNGNYSKSNCRWATCTEQSLNRKTSNIINGKNLKTLEKELNTL